MSTQEIVQKLWNLCNVLRDDGITYHQYVTELTYLLFLKMMEETGKEEKIPEEYCFKSKEDLDKGLVKLDKYWSTVDAINKKAHESFLKHSTKMFKKIVKRPEFAQWLGKEDQDKIEKEIEEKAKKEWDEMNKESADGQESSTEV